MVRPMHIQHQRRSGHVEAQTKRPKRRRHQNGGDGLLASSSGGRYFDWRASQRPLIAFTWLRDTKQIKVSSLGFRIP